MFIEVTQQYSVDLVKGREDLALTRTGLVVVVVVVCTPYCMYIMDTYIDMSTNTRTPS